MPAIHIIGSPWHCQVTEDGPYSPGSAPPRGRGAVGSIGPVGSAGPVAVFPIRTSTACLHVAGARRCQPTDPGPLRRA
ncbi:hypothetical protein SAVIM40S_05248 [Streptomyces avidinii]